MISKLCKYNILYLNKKILTPTILWMRVMKINIENNKYMNHWINHLAIFAVCIGFGYYIRLGFIMLKGTRYWIEIQFFYWRIFIMPKNCFD